MLTRSTTGRVLTLVVGFFIVYAMFFSITAALVVHAAVSDWQKGATINPESSTDFASDTMKASLKNLRATGATYVALVVPYYQSNIYSIDIKPGWNTPSDASLIAAIDYAHLIGLSVVLKPHVEPYSNEWRAYINPSDRNGWFNAYGGDVVHLAQIGAAHHVEMLVVGTELVSMAASNMNTTNTQHWLDLIKSVRSVYSGKLTYGANSTNNNADAFQNEKKFIGFWSALDYAGLSVYYNLNTSSNSVDSLKTAWDYWNKNDLKTFQQGIGKPLLFIEIGYRSVTNAHYDPWNWQRSGAIDQTEQANNYEALMSYWTAQPYLAGVFWWDWESNPNAGGGNTSSYTPQNKSAQAVLSKWYGSNTSQPPTSSQPPPPTTPPAATPGPIDVWWPTEGSRVSGVQPFKAMVENIPLTQYHLYWQVDGDRLNEMIDSSKDYPHKEASIDLTNWRWRGVGRYELTFVSKDLSGALIGKKTVHIWVQ
jgi:hypothetical protein